MCFVFNLVINSDVDIENVALDQRPAVRDPMRRHVIDRARDTFWETLKKKLIETLGTVAWCFIYLKI